MRGRPIYVESRIRCDIDELWRLTQDPDQHTRWDLRFGKISYVPDQVDGQPRQFVYATTVAGIRVAGTGESLGDRNRPDGSRWSGLKFWADDRRSVIKSGAGYWKYVPTEDGLRFLTRYDYRTRWGRVGEWVDRFAFRPAFGWATAWSFDRLRLWLEEDIPPEQSARQYLTHLLAVAGLTGVWIYQGLVPKLIKVDDDEVRIWRGLGVGPRTARTAVRAVGVAEIVAGVLTARHHRRPVVHLLAAAAMPLLAAGAAVTDRRSLSRAFNPVSLNWALVALAGVGAATTRNLPSGRRPLRVAPDRQPVVGDLP